MADEAKPDQPGNVALEIGTRLVQPPGQLLVETAFAHEISQQTALREALGLVDIAHTLVAMQAGVVPLPGGRALLQGLLELQDRPELVLNDPAAGDLCTNRERWLRKNCDGVGWFGVGRARREATTGAYVLVVRRAALKLIDSLCDAVAALIDCAQDHRESLMPDYTYWQAAQPTTFGHYMLAFAYPLMRDAERTIAFIERANHSPLGGGSTNGSRLIAERETIAKLLGFAAPVVHCRDAMWQADLAMEFAAILSIAAVGLDRLAEDLQMLSTQEFGLIQLDDSHARASKIMPQKKNPFALTHIRGIANESLGSLTAIVASSRVSTGQPDSRAAAYGLNTSMAVEIAGAARLMAEVVAALEFDRSRGRELLQSGAVLATDLAEELCAQSTLNFRDAYRLVGILSRERGDLAGLTATELSRTANKHLGHHIDVGDDVLARALDPRAAVAARSVAGGAAPESVAAMITAAIEPVDRARSWVEKTGHSWDSVEAALLTRARRESKA